MRALVAFAGACAFGVLTSLVFDWARGKSALWNMFLGAAVFLAGVAAASLGIVLFARQLSN